VRSYVEIAWESLSRHGEELCGDTVKVASMPKAFIVVLSDGLGSGVKAHILSTLTAQIAGAMFQWNADVEEVMETLAETLPECQQRKLAYATFAMLKIVNGREAFLVEYDSPPLILVRDGQIVDLPTVERQVHGRTVREGRFEVQVGDYMVLVSDGYEHAGVGGLYRLGWGWKNIATSVKRWCATGGDAHSLASALVRTCRRLYDDRPGDDATAVAMRVRKAVRATVLTGPPSDRAHDAAAVQRLVRTEGLKVICGGTTAQMAARVMGKPLEVEWVPPSRRRDGQPDRKKGSPPTARLEGIDLVTEGIITLGQTLEYLEHAETVHDLPHESDAANRLARILLSSDDIHLIVGTAINPNQVADVIRGETMRMMYVKSLVRELERRNKQVTVERI
jgi:hypothetical protein